MMWKRPEVLKVFFPSDLTSNISLWESQVPETRKKTWNKEDSVKEGHTREHLDILDMHP